MSCELRVPRVLPGRSWAGVDVGVLPPQQQPSCGGLEPLGRPRCLPGLVEGGSRSPVTAPGSQNLRDRHPLGHGSSTPQPMGQYQSRLLELGGTAGGEWQPDAGKAHLPLPIPRGTARITASSVQNLSSLELVPGPKRLGTTGLDEGEFVGNYCIEC